MLSFFLLFVILVIFLLFLLLFIILLNPYSLSLVLHPLGD